MFSYYYHGKIITLRRSIYNLTLLLFCYFFYYYIIFKNSPVNNIIALRLHLATVRLRVLFLFKFLNKIRIIKKKAKSTNKNKCSLACSRGMKRVQALNLVINLRRSVQLWNTQCKYPQILCFIPYKSSTFFTWTQHSYYLIEKL